LGRTVFDRTPVFRPCSSRSPGRIATARRRPRCHSPNGLRLVLAGSLQSCRRPGGQRLHVLPWLFGALGVLPALTGLLVPIREAGSMLPHAFLTPLILRVRYCKWVFVAGVLIQAMGCCDGSHHPLVEGLTAGVLIVAALAVFALGRC